jgi:hypothetical protein
MLPSLPPSSKPSSDPLLMPRLIRSAERQQPRVLCFTPNINISGSHLSKKGEFRFVCSPGKFVDEDGNAGGLNPDDYSDDKG